MFVRGGTRPDNDKPMSAIPGPSSSPLLAATASAPGADGPSHTGARGTIAAPDRDRLVSLSAPAMEDLHRQFDSPTITVLLADGDGTVLRSIGGAVPTHALAGRSTAHEGEAAANALARRPPLPPGQLGIAVPILPTAGALLGFVDADAAPLDWLGHANALLQTSARLIEHRLIETEPRGFLLLRFHRYAAVLGTPLEALALFDADGAVLLANHAAHELLAPCAFAQGGAAACFATQWYGIVAYAALGPRQPFVLRDRRGTGFAARACLRRQAA